MPKDYLQRPATEVRRRDRAVTDDKWIADFLNRVPMGTLAVAIDGRPVVNSNLFVYDPGRHAIVFHTAREGRLRSAVARNAEACFSVSEMGRLLPADEALEFSVEYAGVSAYGKVRVVEEEASATKLLQQLMDKYFPHLRPGKDYRPIVLEELKRTAVYELIVEEWVGKRKQVEADFPGAFYYPSEKTPSGPPEN